MESFNAIFQGLRTGKVSSAVAKTVWCHSWVTITDPSWGCHSTCSSSGMWHPCSAMGCPSRAPGDTMGNTTMDLMEHSHFGAPFLFTDRGSVTPMSPEELQAHNTVRHPGNVCYDWHWETEKLLAPWKSPWELFTKWLRNQTYPKLSTSSSSGASAPSHFPFFLCQMDVRKQRKWVQNSPPAKPWSKTGGSLSLCLIPAWFFLLSPCFCLLLIIWH